LKHVGERLGVSRQRAGPLQASAVWRVGCHLQRLLGRGAAEAAKDLQAEMAAVEKLALRFLALRKRTVLKRPERRAEGQQDK
jgi:hypothetical protein